MRGSAFFDQLRVDPTELNVHSMPLLVFVNTKSGDGQAGVTLLMRLRSLLNPVQVVDLRNVGPEAPLRFAARELSSFPVRIVVCGGDGTVGWVLSAIDKLTVKFESAPAVGVVPTGTGNDLARVLGWGGGYREREKTGEAMSMIIGRRTLMGTLLATETAHVALLDRWDVRISKEGTPEDEAAGDKAAVREKGMESKDDAMMRGGDDAGKAAGEGRGQGRNDGACSSIVEGEDRETQTGGGDGDMIGEDEKDQRSLVMNKWVSHIHTHGHT